MPLPMLLTLLRCPGKVRLVKGRVSSCTHYGWQGKGGKGIFLLPSPPLGRQEVCGQLHPQLYLSFTSANRISSTVLPRQGTGPTFLSTAGGKGEGQLLHL